MEEGRQLHHEGAQVTRYTAAPLAAKCERGSAHGHIDLNNSGVLPEQRAWISDRFERFGLYDVYRHR